MRVCFDALDETCIQSSFGKNSLHTLGNDSGRESEVEIVFLSFRHQLENPR